jgi:hypothetical protein
MSRKLTGPPGFRPQRSVTEPTTTDDLFDKLDNVSRAKSILGDMGLLSGKVEKGLDDTQADISATLAGRIKFPAGTRPLVVRHVNKASAVETLFAYTVHDGQDHFESLQVVDAASISLEDPEPPAATDGGPTGTPPTSGGNNPVEKPADA